MSELHLRSGPAAVTIAPEAGGRLASLSIWGQELLVPPGSLGPLQWGSYPMVPWAGRIRNGTFTFDGATHQMPRNLPPHSAHGVGLTAAWTPIDDETIELDLPEPWPFGGHVTQRFALDDDGLHITMTVSAERTMPVMAGWHPWFTRFLRRSGSPHDPVEAELDFGTPPMYELDDLAIPTGRLVPAPPGPWDNCFTSLTTDPTLRWPRLVELRLRSSCDHWVVFTEPADALCVEPQSGAPDEFNRRPVVLEPGRSAEYTFDLRWRRLAPA